jgi:hypothetical protein
MKTVAEILLDKLPKFYHQTREGKLKWLKVADNFFTLKLHSKLPIDEIAIWKPYETPEEGIELKVTDTNSRSLFNKGFSVLFGTYDKSPYQSFSLQYKRLSLSQMVRLSDLFKMIEKKAKTTKEYLKLI